MKTAKIDDLKQIVFNIEFNMPVQRSIVNFEYWYSAADQTSMIFLKNIGEYISDIVSQIKFTPSFVTWPCP